MAKNQLDRNHAKNFSTALQYLMHFILINYDFISVIQWLATTTKFLAKMGAQDFF